MHPTYHEVYARWRADPEAFWAEAAEAVDWYRQWEGRGGVLSGGREQGGRNEQQESLPDRATWLDLPADCA